jgi:hypothetical protein
MITLEAILAALSAADPYAGMDRLVRAEMAAGRKVDDVFNDLNPLTDAALDAPGMTDDGEEAYLGTLDALTGGCHPDSCYTDPTAHPRPPAGGAVAAVANGSGRHSTSVAGPTNPSRG